MPRPRTFDADRALDAAMRVFWRDGFEATSTEDLCAATGLGRSSLYNAFSSKHALFAAALDRYMTERTEATIAVVDGPGTGRDRIAELIWRGVDPEPDDPPGCLVVNSMVELAPVDAEIAAALRRDRERRQTAMRLAIEAGRRDGSLGAGRPAADLAAFVDATIAGLRVATRGGADRATREAIARTALDAL